MNPSYDNGFGSFGSGGTSPGGGVGGMNSGVGSSAGGRAVGGVSGGGSMASGSPMLSGSPMANIPTSSGTGDVVLASAPEKKSRKGLVVGIIVVVLVLVGVGVGAWVLVGSGSKKNVDEIKGSFNRLANYVISGKNTTEMVDSADYDPMSNYYFMDQQNDSQEVYLETKELLDDFMGKYEKVSDKEVLSSNSGLLDSLIKSAYNTFMFMDTIRIKYLPSMDVMLDIYMKNGVETLVEEMKNYYDFSSIKDNDNVSGFSEDFNAWIDLQIEKIELYDRNGCLNNGNFDLDCMQWTSNEVLNELDRVDSANRTVRVNLEYYYDLSGDFIYDIFAINALINNQDISRFLSIGEDLKGDEEAETEEDE